MPEFDPFEIDEDSPINVDLCDMNVYKDFKWNFQGTVLHSTYTQLEMKTWPEKLESIKSKVDNQVTTNLYERACELIKKLESTTITMTLTGTSNSVSLTSSGVRGAGKSEAANLFAAPKSWLKKKKIPLENLGVFPLISERGGKSVTQFCHRLIKRKAAENFVVCKQMIPSDRPLDTCEVYQNRTRIHQPCQEA